MGLTAANVATLIAAGTPVAPGTTTTLAAASAAIDRYCGRQLGSSIATVSHTVCSFVTPFKVGVFFDDTEVGTTTAAAAQSTSETATGATNEAGAAGTYGFSLGFAQISC